MHVGDVDERPRLDVDRTMQTGHPPLVLIFDIAAGAVADDDDGKVVGLADRNPAGDVVLARKPAVGSVSHENPVDVDGVHALGATDV